MIIRYSPSGPPIANANGGSADAGVGFMLRLDEGTTTVDTAEAALTPGVDTELKFNPNVATAPFLRPRLADPSPNRRYRVTGAVDMFTTNSGGTATFTSKIWVSYDEAVTWEVISTVESQLGPATGAYKHCRIDVPLTLGSGLASPMPAAPTSIQVKMTMQSSVNSTAFHAPDGTGGTGFLQLTEHL